MLDCIFINFFHSLLPISWKQIYSYVLYFNMVYGIVKNTNSVTGGCEKYMSDNMGTCFS